ncbi:MAG: PBECR4 domain-containing protein [Eubacteriales bacterium]
MFTKEDLLTLEKMPTWNDISLALYKEFASNVLFPKTFRYYLENGLIIDIQFKEWAMKHLWGIQHIDSSVKNTELFEKIDNGLSFADFSKTKAMKNRLMDNRDRIRMFACVYTVLRTGSLFYIEGGQVPNSEIRIDYIKSKEIDSKGVNLGMRYEENVYVPLTLLIDRAIDPTRTVRNLTLIKVMKMEIIENNIIIESKEYKK